MNNENFITLATKSLSGEASQDDLDELKELLKNEVFKSEYESLKVNWNRLTLPTEYSDFNIQKGLNKLHKKINKFSVPEPVYVRERNFPEVFTSSYLLKIAACLAFLIIISSAVLYLNGFWEKSTDGTSLLVKSTLPGQKSIITLLDGTSIILNSDSKLRIPQNFNGNNREVYLEGEAYFEVAHDSTSPFIVHSNNFEVTVLGTVFDVKAFPNENNYSVSLVNGKVKVTNDYLKKESIVLKPDEQYSYDKTSGRNKIGNFDYQQVTGWKDNILIFNDTKLSEVFIQLKRAYGIKFKLSDKSYSDLKINADFRNDSFWTIIKVLTAATNLDYKTVSDDKNQLKQIVFYKK